MYPRLVSTRAQKAADCVFCRVIAGDASGHFVMADQEVVAILDIRPLFVGHMLVMPRDHHETLVDLPAHMIEPLFSRAQALAAAAESALAAQGTFVAMNNRVSQSVPHLHVHVVPRRRGDGLRGFFWPRTRYESPQEAAWVARRLADVYEASTGSLS